jgi:hypothetical protein
MTKKKNQGAATGLNDPEKETLVETFAHSDTKTTKKEKNNRRGGNSRDDARLLTHRKRGNATKQREN